MWFAAMGNPPNSKGLVAVGGDGETAAPPGCGGEGRSGASSKAGGEIVLDSDKERERLSRKFSQASVCSTDANNDEDDEEGNGEDEDEKNVVLLGPQVPLKEQLELDKVRLLPSLSSIRHSLIGADLLRQWRWRRTTRA